jgi:hypothetical protein
MTMQDIAMVEAMEKLGEGRVTLEPVDPMKERERSTKWWVMKSEDNGLASRIELEHLVRSRDLSRIESPGRSCQGLLK